MTVRAVAANAHARRVLPIFRLPEGADGDYGSMLVGFRTNARVSAPWKQALADGIVNRVLPAQLVDEHPNLEHHVRHSALPRPCGLMIDAFAVRARV